MDLVVLFFDKFLVGPIASGAGTLLTSLDAQMAAKISEAVPAALPPASPVRQFIVAWLVLTLGALAFYFFFSTLNFYLLHRTLGNLNHAPFKNQVRMEISMACRAIPWMGLLTAPIVVLECQGYSRLYGPGTDVGYADYGHAYTLATCAIFLVFTDGCIYFIHRALHWPMFYKTLHKDHHKWKSPTPFASHAFHPVDGWAQSVPYHVFAFIVPMHKVVFLALFVFVNVWTVSIHDGVTAYPFKFLNGAAHHTYHHKDFNYNYGQYFVFWDWLGGTLRDPYAPGRLLDPAQWEKKKTTGVAAMKKED
eukprot:g2960.t1